MNQIINNIKHSFKLNLDNEKSTNLLVKEKNWIRPMSILLVISFIMNLFTDLLFAVIFLLFSILIAIGSVYYLQLFFKLFGGKGSFAQTFTVLANLQLAPTIVFFILGIITGFSFLASNLLGQLLSNILFVIIMFYVPWFVYIFIKTMSKVQKLTPLKTYLAGSLSLITFIIIILILISVALSFLGIDSLSTFLLSQPMYQ